MGAFSKNLKLLLGLTRVMLDDESFLDRRGDVGPVGKAVDRSLESVVVGEEPGRGRAGGLGCLTGHRLDGGTRLDGDLVAGRNLVRRTVEALAVHLDVLVDDE